MPEIPLEQRDLVAAAVIYRGEPSGLEILSARRTEPAHLRGGWELPGGRVETTDASWEAAAQREVLEELGCVVEVVEMLAGPHEDKTWPLTDDKRMAVFLCHVIEGEPYILEQHDAIAWIRLSAATTAVPWLSVDIPIVEAAIERISALGAPSRISK
jgi:8-oxo-dGTP diphosphatase